MNTLHLSVILLIIVAITYHYSRRFVQNENQFFLCFWMVLYKVQHFIVVNISYINVEIKSKYEIKLLTSVSWLISPSGANIDCTMNLWRFLSFGSYSKGCKLTEIITWRTYDVLFFDVKWMNFKQAILLSFGCGKREIVKETKHSTKTTHVISN